MRLLGYFSADHTPTYSLDAAGRFVYVFAEPQVATKRRWGPERTARRGSLPELPLSTRCSRWLCGSLKTLNG